MRGLWDDWYPYGLIITEHRLLKAIFAALESRIARPVGPHDFATHSEASRRLRALLGLKFSWPYRRVDAPGPCHFPFENGLYPRPELHWPSAARPCASYEVIFRELESEFVLAQDMLLAEKQLDGLFGRICDVLD